MTNYNEDYQYNSCTSRGICSVNPRTSSLQEILLIYITISAYYVLKLKESGYKNKPIRNLILNTISITVSNPEFSENDFNAIIKGFNEELPKIIDMYIDFCKRNGKEPEHLEIPAELNKSENIVDSIRLGQKEYLKRIKNLSESMRDLYRIMFVLAKSICINILDLESFGVDDGYILILELLNKLNFNNEENELKTFILNIAEADNKLMKRLYFLKEEKYGVQRPKEVSYSTIPGKAILVVGSNIRELEIILEEFKEDEVFVYTHDEMMLAHTFPKFEEYANLQGQFGQGMENCLLDFATFPGPIILTRHSLYNVENLYRGRLYTTDFAYSKGVIPITDFSEVRKGIEETKGFKTGKVCSSEKVGFNYDDVIATIKTKLETESYTKIFIIGLNGYTKEDREYYNKFLDIVPDDVLVISLSCYKEKNNVVYLNACFDSYAMLRISDEILNQYDLKTYLIFPKCDIHTISKMIYFSNRKGSFVYVGKCTPITLNPNLIFTLTKIFNIKGLTTPKKDLERIMNEK